MKKMWENLEKFYKYLQEIRGKGAEKFKSKWKETFEGNLLINFKEKLKKMV